MKQLSGCLALLAVVAAILITGFFCVGCAGEAIRNVDTPMWFRLIQVVAGAGLLIVCIAFTYLLVGAGAEAWRGSE